MLGRFPHLSKFAIKLIEIAGAGCASAVVAFMLDSSRHTPVVPAVTRPAVVRLAPADAQMIETVRSESVALAEHLRSELEARSVNPTPLPAAKPAKPAANAAPKREQKAVRTQAVEVKQRIPEAKPVQAQAAEVKPVESEVPYPAPPTATPAVSVDRSSTVTVGKEARTAATIPPPEPTPGWLARLGSASDIPRPPVAISPSVSSAM
jgi:hypothetical protein